MAYLFARAQNIAPLNENISAVQHEKIEAACRRDVNRAANSDSFLAMDHDVRVFGRRASYKDNVLQTKISMP